MSPPFGPDWAADDAATFGEGVPRCDYDGCNSPLELIVGSTLVVERCQQARHVTHIQMAYPDAWFPE